MVSPSLPTRPPPSIHRRPLKRFLIKKVTMKSFGLKSQTHSHWKLELVKGPPAGAPFLINQWIYDIGKTFICRSPQPSWCLRQYQSSVFGSKYNTLKFVHRNRRVYSDTRFRYYLRLIELSFAICPPFVLFGLCDGLSDDRVFEKKKNIPNKCRIKIESTFFISFSLLGLVHRLSEVKRFGASIRCI